MSAEFTFREIPEDKANERERLVFGEDLDMEKYRYGGVRHFSEMTPETARKLMELGFIDPEDAQNCSPEAEYMVAFCEEMGEGWYLHGYVVSPTRSDCRITFEGIESTTPCTAEEAIKFMRAFRFADEVCADIGQMAYCWYD